MFKDTDCLLIGKTELSKAKYFKTTLYAPNQEAFKTLSHLSSKKGRVKTIFHNKNYKIGLWTWTDLEEAARAGCIYVGSDVHDLVGKFSLINDLDTAEKVLLKLKGLFGSNFYLTLTGVKQDRFFKSFIKFTLVDGEEVVVKPDNQVVAYTYTGQEIRTKAKEILDNPTRFKAFSSYILNDILYKKSGAIKKVEVIQGYFKFEQGDIQLNANNFVMGLAHKHAIPLVYSDQAYYAKKDDKIVQDVRLSADEQRESCHRYMQSTSEAMNYLTGVMGLGELGAEEILSNTEKFCGIFDNFELKYEYQLPTTTEDPMKKAYQIITEVGRMQWGNEVYVKRLKHELNVLVNNGKINLLPYFFPIVDVLKNNKDNGVLNGPARGSAAGSLLPYLLGITHVDPIKYGLSFERFLSLDRVQNGDLPDLDVDSSQKTFLEKYLSDTYGNRAAHISTKHMLRLKSSIKEVSRYFNEGSVNPEIEDITKNLPDPPQGVEDSKFVRGYTDTDGNSIAGIIETNEVLKYYIQKYPKEWEIVEKCLGLGKTFSVHASAYILSNDPIENFVPMTDEGVTQYDAKGVEAAKLIKYDFLVVNQLKDIEDCIKRVNKRHGVVLEVDTFIHDGKHINIWDLPIDQAVFKSVESGDTETIFQINTNSMRPFVRSIKPKNIEDLSTILALVRPGPLDFVDEKTGRNMAEEFVERRNGSGSTPIPEMLELLPETYGIQCLAAGTRVKTSLGIKNIEEIAAGDIVQTESGGWNRVSKTLNQGIKKTIKIHSDNGQELILTSDHKVLTQSGWKEAGTLTRKDLIKSYWASDSDIEEGSEKDYVIGLCLADGSLCGSQSVIAAGCKEKANKIKEIADIAFNLDCSIYFSTRCWYVGLRSKQKGFNELNRYLKKVGLKGLNCYTKKWPDKITKKMILGYLDGDGNWKNRTVRTCNYNLALGLFESFQAMRVRSYLRQSSGKVWTVGWDEFYTKSRLSSYQTEYTRPTIGIVCPKPDWQGVVLRKDNRRQHFYPQRMRNKPYLSRDVLTKIAKDYGKTFDENQSWSRVLKAQEWKELPVYDLSIENEHSFVAGGLVVHNCFQEQTTKVAKEIGGMTPVEAETLRRHFSKKNVVKAMEMKPTFMRGAVPNVGQSTAETIWAQMETSSRYSFNCIAGEQLVMTSRGPVPMVAICSDPQNYMIASYNAHKDVIYWEKPSFAKDMGEKEVWTVELGNKRIVEATPDHRFLCEHGQYDTLQNIVHGYSKIKTMTPTPFKKEMRPTVLKKENRRVYDIEMPTHHNFVLDGGAIAHNCSHSISYALITYACMFLKHHYPLEWWASVLSNASEKEISGKLMRYVRDFVSPPDIRLSSADTMEIDYERGKILSKLTVLKGLGKATADKIIQARPYSTLREFVDKKACSASVAQKLIYVGVMDSFFDPSLKPLQKIERYLNTMAESDRDKKIAEGKNPSANDGIVIYENYTGLHEIKEFLLKKKTFPAMPINLTDIMISRSTKQLIGSRKEKMGCYDDSSLRSIRLISGDDLYNEDYHTSESFKEFCFVGYVMKVKELGYQDKKTGETKSRLALNLDCDGQYIDTVMWANRDTGKLEYPPELKEGTVAIFFCTKYKDRPWYPYEIVVENQSVISKK